MRAGFANAVWYMAYLVFLGVMSYVGSVGAKALVSLDLGSLIVALVSASVFLPWGVASRVSTQEIDRLHGGLGPYPAGTGSAALRGPQVAGDA